MLYEFFIVGITIWFCVAMVLLCIVDGNYSDRSQGLTIALCAIWPIWGIVMAIIWLKRALAYLAAELRG